MNLEILNTRKKQANDLWSYLQSTDKKIVMYGMGNGADKLFSRLAEIGVTPADVFASDGEAFFRELETELIKELSEKEGYIISLGGGLAVGGDRVGLALMSDLTGADLATRQHGGGVAHGIPQLTALKDTHLHKEAVLGGVVHAHRGVGDVDAVGDGGGVGGGGSIGA